MDFLRSRQSIKKIKKRAFNRVISMAKNIEQVEETRKDTPVEKDERHRKDTDTEDGEPKDIPLEKMTKAELIAKIKTVRESAEKNYDLFVRSQAEIENMKKRFQKEKEDLIKFSNESLIKQLLSVIDNLEKAITHSQEQSSLKALIEGVELTLKGLIGTLSKAGLDKVKTVGETFDPNFHEAVSEQEDNSVKPGVILHELQKGYTLNDRLIRPAMVVVSKSETKAD
jgi:molecular chaperone GrpE